ncbi:uncharacterized protein TNCT_570121 [Trichonephila clavata]|uniref:Uncharacterized protein n=2 Tax=Trichonephila clavata TaxID=2740835 RepID=A0A8X6KHD7_TRICU|nr:uncharacterized protein TNCT_450851 [Trichonephila clavata]GFQ65680.1 uncharacterized protein TNCT_375801 [Trichonephila clavata]GFQ65688.1 uncharacterized protein TNCT_375841 [Trichonephila clavata]GFQ69231.1 uncharacterized protein TNCT_367611 [Trichonephila clavata]GFQ73894.1 uncharacterized protein TNCT_248191 [Trichonephila clavata]
MSAARVIFNHVATVRPDIYQQILHLIQPHSLEAILELFQHHLEQSVPDLRRFNQHQACLPDLCLKFVRLIRKRFPSPGDAFGIQLTCRVTKSDTQGTLDSKHLKSQEERDDAFHVDALLLGELHCFSTQTQVFELATRHGYSTVFTRGYTGQELLQRLPDACLLTRGLPYNKGRTLNGTYKYLNTCTFIVVPDNKVVYRTSAKHWLGVLRRLDAERVLAFSDIRAIFQKCGIVAYFFNWMRVVQEQLPLQNSVQMKNIMTILKYQCRTGRPLPLTRDGLAKNPERSPLEILSFEAWKRNCAHMCIEAPSVQVNCSTEKMFFGQQFREGTGYDFCLRNKNFVN